MSGHRIELASESRDRVVLALSSGAFAGAAVLFKDKRQNPPKPLRLSWGLLAASTIAVLSSFITSELSHRHALKEIRKTETVDDVWPGGVWDRASVLRSATGWFDSLAGRDESGRHGLRDLLVHRGARYQLSGRVDTSGDMSDLRFSVWNISSGEITGNVKAELVEIFSGFCEFLDLSLSHFLERLSHQLDRQMTDDDWHYLMFESTQVPDGSWVFPPI